MAETSMTKIRADFDRIALLPEDNWSHNSHYHSFLLKQIPLRCTEVLEIGCGTGAFSRLIARRSDRVLALDLSPRMIQIAKARSKQLTNIDFQITDAMEWEFPSQQFDCITSIATLHHLPMEEMLAKMKQALKVNGTLVVLDLFEEEKLPHPFASMLALTVSKALKLMKNKRLKESREVQKAWSEHGRSDSYLTLPQIRQMCTAILPGAIVRKHLLWRYSLIWKKNG